MGFRDEIHSIDTPPVDDRHPTLPAMWWYHGTRRPPTGGVFYVKADALRDPPEEPWRPSQRFSGERGFEADQVQVLPICYRQQPYRIVTVGAGREQRRERRYLAKWEPGAQFHTELLCMAEGIQEPVVWSCRGMTSKALTGRGGIMDTYVHGLLKLAQQEARKKDPAKTLPLWTFWLPIATQRDAQGRVVHHDTGFGSFVTLPVVLIPPVEVLIERPAELEQLLDTLYAGKEWIAYGYDLFHQFADWRNERRGEAASATDRTGSPHPVSDGNGADDDLPF